MKSVAVVIPHYPLERRPNLPVVLDALYAGTRAPDEVIVWNNDGHAGGLGVRADVIQSHRNVGAKARFLAALTARSDYVVFQDNDVAVLHDTLEQMVEFALRLPLAVLTCSGRVLEPSASYRSSRLVRSPDRITRVDISLGQCELVPRTYLPRLLAEFPFEDSTVMDDIHFSASVRAARWDILALPGVGFRDLNMRGVGACRQPAHYTMRDELCRQFFAGDTAADREGRRAELGRA